MCSKVDFILRFIWELTYFTDLCRLLVISWLMFVRNFELFFFEFIIHVTLC